MATRATSARSDTGHTHRSGALLSGADIRLLTGSAKGAILPMRQQIETALQLVGARHCWLRVSIKAQYCNFYALLTAGRVEAQYRKLYASGTGLQASSDLAP